MIECAGFDADFENDFPTKEGRYLFYKEYILAYCSCLPKTHVAKPIDLPNTNVLVLDTTTLYIGELLQKSHLSSAERSEIDCFLLGFDDSVTKYTLASHLFWGSWSIVQASTSRIQFDFLPYSLRRAKGYQLHKNQFFV